MDHFDKEKASLSVARNTFYLISAQVIGKSLTFLFYIVIARYLGATELGKYSFILGLVGMFIILTNFGLDNMLVRDIALKKEKAMTYISNALAIKTLFAFCSIIALTVVMPLTLKTSDVTFGVYIYCSAIFSEGLATGIESVFNAFEKLKYVAFIDIIVNLLKLTIAAVIKLNQLDLIHLIISVAVLSIIRALISMIILRKHFFKLKLNFDTSLIKHLLKGAYPFALMGILSAIYFRIDSIMLSLMKNDAAVGWYAASFNILAVLMFISYGFNRAVFPVLSRSYEDSKQAFLAIGEKSFNYMFVLGLPIALGITVLADKIILLLYGDMFFHSIWALKILIWSIPLIYINSPLLRILYSSHKQKVAMTIAFFSMLTNLGLNFLLIPRFSYIGASISTLVSELFNFIFLYVVVSKIFSYHIRLNSMALKSLGALFAMGIFLYLLRDFHLIFVIPISAAVYFFVLYQLKAISPNELAIVKNLFQKRQEE